MTRRERLQLLIVQVDELADEIERAGRKREARQLAATIREDPSAITPIGDLEWNAMLEDERKDRLVERYLTLRSELVALEREGRKQQGAERKRWLDGDAPKVVSLMVGVSELVKYGIEVLHAAGILAHERGEPSGTGDGDELA